MEPEATLTMRNVTEKKCGQAHDIHGGVAHAQGKNHITVTNSTLSDNEAFNGAVFFLNDSSLTFTSCEVRGDLAINLGGVFTLVKSSATISKSVFTSNHAQDGAVIYMVDSAAQITESSITGNAAIVKGDGVSCLGKEIRR